MIEQIEIPCCCQLKYGGCERHKVFVKEFAGRVQLHISHPQQNMEDIHFVPTIKVELNFDDLAKAWHAIKKT